MGDDSEFHLLNGSWPPPEDYTWGGFGSQSASLVLSGRAHSCTGDFFKIQFWTGLLVIQKAMCCEYFWTCLLCNFKQGELGDSIFRRRGYFLKFILWTLLTILADIFLDRSTLHRGIIGRVDSCTEVFFHIWFWTADDSKFHYLAEVFVELSILTFYMIHFCS